MKRLIWYLIGLSIGGIGLAIISPSKFAAILPWKFGYGASVTLLVACVLSLNSNGGRWRPAILLLIAIGVYSFSQGARSLAGITVFAALSFMLLSSSQRTGGRKGVGVAVAILFVIAGSGYGVFEGYTWAAKEGALGQDAKAKFDEQSRSSLSFLLAGRSEAIISTRAILDSPIIGHGSWARNRDYVAEHKRLLRQYGMEEAGDWDKSDLIPTHSHLLGAWVEAGILGAAFWLWCLYLIGRAAFAVVRSEALYTPLTLYVMMTLGWAIFFSPFGTVDKTATAGFLILIMTTLKAQRSSTQPNLANSEFRRSINSKLAGARTSRTGTTP
jgi:hypothetical protein